MGKIIKVVAPKDLMKGEEFEFELPTPERKPRGQLAGIALKDMTDEQLKREIINANSVLYKAKQRKADPKVIEANQIRVDAAKAEKASRIPATEAKEAAKTPVKDAKPAKDVKATKNAIPANSAIDEL